MPAETTKMILGFRDRRHGNRLRNPLALSGSLEAAALPEDFQWGGSDLDCTGKRDQRAEELADAFSDCVLMAGRQALDQDEIVPQKIQANEEKHPVAKTDGKRERYTEYQRGDKECCSMSAQKHVF